jgi:hypothetical protein
VPVSVLNSFAGCGNPLAIDALERSEVVLDLGVGAGLDCFLAAKKVGPGGLVIGLDWTGRIGGAIPLDDYLGKLKAAGFADVQVVTPRERQPLMLSVKIKAVKGR